MMGLEKEEGPGWYMGPVGICFNHCSEELFIVSATDLWSSHLSLSNSHLGCHTDSDSNLTFRPAVMTAAPSMPTT